MKRCLVCNAHYLSSCGICSVCGESPAIVDGFEAYAPHFAHGGGGFEANYFSDLARLEEDNFWFRARNGIILWALNQYFPRFESFLEIGCGTGYVLSEIVKHFPNATLFGSEIFTEGLSFAAARIPQIHLMQMDARDIPFYEEFDVIGAFDVLEHIKEDGVVLSQVHQALKPKGVMVLTVPQHAWLWSSVDEYSFHERRYAAIEIHKMVREAGFRIVRSTSFVTTLLPAMMISRLWQKRHSKNFDSTAELQIPRALNSIFVRMLALELSAIKAGINLPLGGSRLVVSIKC